MKKLLFSLFFLLTFTALMAQAPQRISYQSIIRDANKVVVASSSVGIKISLLKGTATGPAVYVETHGITTNANGLVSLNIGEGTAIAGSFAGIDWANGPYLIQTATDPTGGTDYSIIGTAPLNSVPYALNATSAGMANSLAGTLAIANGGTGATTAAAARAALGLENVDNTSDANKPVSTAVQTALSTKVDKVTGKELSTNDYSAAEKAKLAAITGTNTGDQDLSAFATTAAVALKVNSADVTNDLATKVDKVTGKELSTNDYSTAEKAKLAAITGTNTGDQVDIAGNAATATKLQSAVTINGIAFDGSGDITLPTSAAGIPYTGATQAVDLGAYNLKVYGLTIGRGGGNVDGNTANGSMSLYSNSSGNSNTAYGYASLYSNTTGSSNIANGNQSLYFNTTGSNNTAIGNASLNKNTTGSDNTANGFGALYLNTGGYNTASGSRSLYSNTTGGSNTALGYFTGTTNTTGNQNTFIGYSADVSSNNLSNATALGNEAIVTASNTIQLGNTSVTNLRTSGTITAGAVTYPNVHNTTAGQVLTTNASGVASWTTPAAGLPSSGNTAGDMLFWNGSAWVKVAAGSNGQTLSFYNGAPVWTGNANTVVSVVSTTGKIWMDRNLGATQVATSSTDAASYGDLYQWGRGTDGHQIRTSTNSANNALSGSDVPGNSLFIITSSAPLDWRSGQNVNLWQGVSGVNNPCPTGYRIPTGIEWNAEVLSWSAYPSATVGAFASPLKLPVAGYRNYNGLLGNVDTRGSYWSSTVSTTVSSYLALGSGASLANYSRAAGFSVRCIKD